MHTLRERPRFALRPFVAIVVVASMALTFASCGPRETAQPVGSTETVAPTLTSQPSTPGSTGNLGSTAETTGPDSHAVEQDALPAIVVDSPTPGATVQSPVRVTGTVIGGTAVDVSLVIVSDDGSFIARWAEAFQNTEARVAFDESFAYAPAYAGGAARIVMTVTAVTADGQPTTSTIVVPIDLQ